MLCDEYKYRVINKIAPVYLWSKLTNFPKEDERVHIILSFDCDTDGDALAALKMIGYLNEKKIQGTFAVPGETLIRNINTYKEIASKGFSFINHGFAEHAYWLDNRFWSKTFYRDMSRKDVKNDILMADVAIKDLLKVNPSGFRSPHFGMFCKNEEIDFLHNCLVELGYKYSSSTTPIYSFKKGPIVKMRNFIEFPISGSIKNPFSVFDSWSNIESPYYPEVGMEYFDTFFSTISFLVKNKLNVLLNYYVDPTHIIGNDYFIKSLDYALNSGCVFVDFDYFIR